MSIDTAPLYALTLWRPWQEPVAAGVKRIENRSWPPPRRLLRRGTPLAIHGGKRYDFQAAIAMREQGFWTPLPAAVKHPLVGALFSGQEPSPEGIVAVVRVDGFVTESDDPWFSGPYGWVLRDAVAITPPIPCNGARGIWRVPTEVAVEIVRRLRARREEIDR